MRHRRPRNFIMWKNDYENFLSIIVTDIFFFVYYENFCQSLSPTYFFCVFPFEQSIGIHRQTKQKRKRMQHAK